MHDLPFAALIVSLAALLIFGAGGAMRLALLWAHSNTARQDARDRAHTAQTMLATAMPIIQQIMQPPHARRRLNPDRVCPVCGEEEETGAVDFGQDGQDDETGELPEETPLRPHKP